MTTETRRNLAWLVVCWVSRSSWWRVLRFDEYLDSGRGVVVIEFCRCGFDHLSVVHDDDSGDGVEDTALVLVEVRLLRRPDPRLRWTAFRDLPQILLPGNDERHLHPHRSFPERGGSDVPRFRPHGLHPVRELLSSGVGVVDMSRGLVCECADVPLRDGIPPDLECDGDHSCH